MQVDATHRHRPATLHVEVVPFFYGLCTLCYVLYFTVVGIYLHISKTFSEASILLIARVII